MVKNKMYKRKQEATKAFPPKATAAQQTSVSEPEQILSFLTTGPQNDSVFIIGPPCPCDTKWGPTYSQTTTVLDIINNVPHKKENKTF